jgi:hypothetical protein
MNGIQTIFPNFYVGFNHGFIAIYISNARLDKKRISCFMCNYAKMLRLKF